ncbi:ABC-type spermidine/putrescine transport system,ATPase component [Halalkaliarchaeum sp. AArc-CO]|uniref:ABC transporter ATP-binding protein n=1 Tax=unclassified Halalkaliarchaeum TaxID=2678344 RepID=UPI00217D147A|nr:MULTISPECIES: sn-glycerol-3-phosphate ABC transporter ATP-binding protein UgpC [unclassified Halalkaliarchaeum]MDR5673327.1 sn-glycerol-3-phosphate ABC transporter ATP-binding protein UgpC [Halalkaliarchaeum sp. AArc-GB]UWG49668.1 ABC-type spermidine/putrescine transport system,ATPase component [Halalkaliarchaeum sp. AArc-CO]
MAQLELDAVTKVFGDGDESVVAVEDVSVDIADGEFLVLVGPSGCGKSTTLRMVAGLETVTDGEIRLDGRRINERPPAERDIAMVFQSYALYPHMTVRGNMRFGLEESTDLSDEEMDRRVEETAELLDIPELLDRKPGALSGGQQQRVALGRAIVRDPAVFLMDEPLSNLDAKLRSQMRTELQQLQADLGTTTVYVTHDQTEAMTMGDRIAILDSGRLQQVATPLEAYHRPANRFVAGFIGEPSMNFLETTVESGTLAVGKLRYPLSGEAADAVVDGQAITLGIRPEDIRIGPGIDAAVDGEAGDPSDGELETPTGVEPDRCFRGTVDVVEPMGNENSVHLSLADGPELTATIEGLRRIEAGSAVSIGIPLNAIHLFDAESGEAVHNRSLEDADMDAPRL